MKLPGWLFFFAILCFAGGFGGDRQALFPEVTFLPKAPVIDGILDAELENLPLRRFAVMRKSAASNPGLNVHYRLAYGTEFLYIYIEAEQPEINARDRGYQNGDGFHVVLTLPRPGDDPSDEFYVLGFTPTKSADRRWQRQFIWYRNIDVSLRPLKQAQFKESISAGKVGFEALIPWIDVYPYHPWLSEALGFNLCYVQAVGDVQNNLHFVLNDTAMQAEQQPRKYVRFKFQEPVSDGTVQMYAVLARNHLFDGDIEKAKVAVLAPKSQKIVQKIAISPRGGPYPFSEQAMKSPTDNALGLNAPGLSPAQTSVQSGEMPRKNQKKVHLYSFSNLVKNGLTVLSLGMNVPGFATGMYDVWFSAWDRPQTELSILPEFAPSDLARALEKARKNLKKGSLSTLQFELEDLQTELARLRPYDLGERLLPRMEALAGTIAAAKKGRDLLVLDKSPGLRRRAYRSALDGTLQPYTLVLPQNFSEAQPYPLLVWLHGSGQDDRSLSPRLAQLANGFIVLSPKARGTSNFYCRDHAQDDIREAMADVLENFPIDQGNILLGGFSMGGYGVYRTVYENPSPYKALIIWAGHPYLKGSDIDFLEEKNLAGFRNKEMFIYHGGMDRNCPIEKTLDLVEKLKKAGAKVEFHYEPALGHQAPGQETASALVSWLNKIRQQ
jgi:predicted esterase